MRALRTFNRFGVPAVIGTFVVSACGGGGGTASNVNGDLGADAALPVFPNGSRGLDPSGNDISGSSGATSTGESSGADPGAGDGEDASPAAGDDASGGNASGSGGSSSSGGAATTGSKDAGVESSSKDAGAASHPKDAGTGTVMHDAGAATKDAGGNTPPPAGGSGCGNASVQTGTFHLQTTDGNGTSRDFEVMVPTPYNASTPLDVTFVYHGAGGNESQSVAFGLQGASGAASASIFVFPQGIAYQNFGVGWDDLCNGYDMVFFDNMLNTIEDAYCVNSAHVFVAGFSWGCDHVTALTCCRGSRIRATAAASCTDEFTNPAVYTTYDNLPCPESGHSGIRFTHDANGDSAFTKQEFTSTSELYQSFNSCSSSSTATSDTPCEQYASCSNPYIECPYQNLGHALPPKWPSETWSFFSTFK